MSVPDFGGGLADDSDPVIERVRAARRRISARFGHDPARLVAHYMELQEQHRERLVSYAPDEPERSRDAA